MSDAVATGQSVTIKRVRAKVYCHPAPLPPWKKTMLIGKPDLKTVNGWTWSLHRNHHPLSDADRSAYKRRALLVIQVPDLLADFGLDELVSVLVP